MKQPWISVIIPTYNGENYLSSTLNSIVSQGDANVECIVVDDGSTDSTLSILEAYSDRLALKLVQRERQGNWVANTNYALSIARSDYVCFLHQDDLWLQNRLQTMKSLIEQSPQVCLYLHSSWFIDKQGKHLGLWQCPLPSYPVLIELNVMMERLLVQNFIAIPAPIFKREVALKLGGLDESLWYTADWDFWLKMASSGQIIYCPKPLTAFRVHPGSQTILRSSGLQNFQKQLQLVLEKHLSQWEAADSLKDRTRQTALFSIEVNTALAAIIHGKKPNLFKLLYGFLSLGPSGWYRYRRDSRISERVSARLKARLKVSANRSIRENEKA